MAKQQLWYKFCDIFKINFYKLRCFVNGYFPIILIAFEYYAFPAYVFLLADFEKCCRNSSIITVKLFADIIRELLVKLKSA